MKIANKISVVLIAFALSLACIFSVFAVTQKTSATSLDDWRPSCAVLTSIDDMNAKIDQDTHTIEFLQDIIQDYETNGNQFSDGIASLEARYNYLHDYINDQRENIEELTKLSYASYFAKTMLEDVVGNKFAADNIFK